MIVVLEGPDNAGKSTLARYIASHLAIPVRHSGGPSKFTGEVNMRADLFNASNTDMIYDRHPCISQNLYGAALKDNRELVSIERVLAFYNKEPFIIYCRPTRGIEGHVKSDHSDADHVAKVERNFDAVMGVYDEWAMSRASMWYRVGDDMDSIVRVVRALFGIEFKDPFDPVADVEDFHKKFGIEYTGLPRILPADLAEFREKFIEEETTEYVRASRFARENVDGSLFGHDEMNLTHHLEVMLDSLVDLTYVVLGAAQLHGFDFRRAWKRVHAANMAKVKAGPNGEGSKRGSKHDVIKPPGWKAPSHTDLVRNHAHCKPKEKVPPSVSLPLGIYDKVE